MKTLKFKNKKSPMSKIDRKTIGMLGDSIYSLSDVRGVLIKVAFDDGTKMIYHKRTDYEEMEEDVARMDELQGDDL